jgi:hypothetical protein
MRAIERAGLAGAVALAAMAGATSLAPTAAMAVDSGGTVEMQRLYNPNSGEHFYTGNTNERDHLVRVGWRSEGTGWTAPKSSDTPVYRLYNPNAGDHHYTTSAYERDSLVKAGWRYEGVGWYSSDSEAVPLYRQYNPNAKAGAHNYTTSKAENDYLVRVGWNAEGIGWYGVDTSEKPHEHVWATRTVTDAAAWDEQVEDKAAWDEQVEDKAAWDEQVEDKAAWDEQVEDKAAWDEHVYGEKPVYESRSYATVTDSLGTGTISVRTDEEFQALTADMSRCYATVRFDSDDGNWNKKRSAQYIKGKNAWEAAGEPATGDFVDPDDSTIVISGGRWSWNLVFQTVQTGTVWGQVDVIHHPATYKTVHHPATYKTVHHPATYKTVHHPATYKTVHHPAVTHEETYCTICGKVKGE